MSRPRNHALPTLDRRLAQFNALSSFMQHHAADYAIQVNFGIFGQPDHACVSIPHHLAAPIYEAVRRALMQSIGEAVSAP